MTKPHLAARLRQAVQRSDTVAPLALAVAVGMLSGLGAVALRWMIRGVQWVFFDQGTQLGRTLDLPIPPQVVTVLALTLITTRQYERDLRAWIEGLTAGS